MVVAMTVQKSMAEELATATDLKEDDQRILKSGHAGMHTPTGIRNKILSVMADLRDSFEGRCGQNDWNSHG